MGSVKFNFKLNGAKNPKIALAIKIGAIIWSIPWILVALICILGGLFCIFSSNNLARKCKVKVDATVIRYDLDTPMVVETKNEGRKEYEMYQPVFRFVLDGKEYIVRSKVCSNDKPFKEGEEIKLKVNPDNPEDVFAPGDKSLTKTGFGFLGFSFLVLFLDGALLFNVFRKPKISGSIKDGKYKFKT